MLEMIDVSKSFGSTCVLQPTSLTVSPGRTTVLIGPSGCGKSTILRLMIGLLTPDTGTIRFEGVTLHPDNLLDLRQRIGYVIQDGGLFPHLSARQNVGLMATHLKWEKSRIEARIAELAALTRFPVDALDRYPVQLSGGQRQRVGIMRALMLDPSLVLLDEPMGALDPLVRYDLQEDLRRIFQELHKTVVLVTHDLGEAEFFGDEVLLLGGGKVLQRGTLAEMAASPADPFVTRFIQAQRIPLRS